MKYIKKTIDQKNLEWFDKDLTKASLIRLEIREGSIRGLSDLKIHFRYPITAIAGRNGVGKSTILALAACAYHNNSTQPLLPDRKTSYYTFSDFFIQSSEETPPQDVSIWYQFLYNNWRRIAPGPGWQKRTKKSGGHWNKYSNRIKRNVVYLGLDRIVPHNEKSVSRSYRSSFLRTSENGWEKDVREIVGRILDKDYDEFWYKKHYKYKLPLVSNSHYVYSGFNMGAGENALLDIFSVIYSCPEGVLLVIDEIELGLHEEAQVRLIDELKNICKEKHIQVICTTHSPRILECLPPEGRLFIEKINDEVKVIPEISSTFASGKLRGKSESELDIFVEDNVAKGLVESGLTNDLRSRINVNEIGSASAVLRQMAARYKEAKAKEACIVLDGDQSSKKQEHIRTFLNALESTKDEAAALNWIEQRIFFLPGQTWPERWILSFYKEGAFNNLAKEFQLEDGELVSYVQSALKQKKHSEFYYLSNKLNLDKDLIRARFSKCAVDFDPFMGSGLQSFVNRFF